METRAVKPLIVIVGPTASGKTSLAITLAQKYGGEIICADSRTVYEGMDIGTAKPTKKDQELVPHWGLDLVLPSQRYAAADFKRYAEQKITEIRERGKIPFLVGGTGLYVDAILFDYQFGSPSSSALRAKFEDYSIQQLHEYCYKNNIKLPNNKYNKRYVIRAIELKSINTKRNKLPLNNTIIVGIATESSLLQERIVMRIEQLFENNVVDEAMKLGKLYGWDNEAMTGNVYRLAKQYHNGELSEAEVKQKLATLDWRLAKRQLTWFKRNEHIQWQTINEAEHYLSDILAPYKNS